MSHGPGTLVLRNDASITMGTGHVMRCLALAQAWQDAGGNAVFAMAELAPSVRERLLSEGMEVVPMEIQPGSQDDARCVAKLAGQCGASWVVVDGYHFDADYQRELKATGLQVLLVDDNGHAGRYAADFVLNQNAHADESLYPNREPCTRLLLGSRYVLLRREFERWREWKREIPAVGRKILVTMGGSDPDNVTARAIEALSQAMVEGLEAIVVVGGSNPHMESLQDIAARCGRSVQLQSNSANMPELMAWADVAISAAGTTCWEMCLLGLPAMLIHLAENQQPIAEALDAKHIAVCLGGSAKVTPGVIAENMERLALSPDKRAAMSLRGKKLLDGRGATRVVSFLGRRNLCLRPVEEKDCQLLWEWANDPRVRAVSFSPDPIPWAQHVEWFRSKLVDRNAVLYLAINSPDIAVGEVRYQLEGARAVVSICLDPKFRGQGYGKMVLRMATEELLRTTQVTAIDAYVKPDNQVSLQLFQRAGFRALTTEQRLGQPAIHFVFEKGGAS